MNHKEKLEKKVIRYIKVLFEFKSLLIKYNKCFPKTFGVFYLETFSLDKQLIK